MDTLDTLWLARALHVLGVVLWIGGVAFVTTHVALAEVPALVTVERIVRVTRLLRDALLEEGVASPLLAMAALNPHAGEDGWMGDEDEKVTKVALAGLRSEQIAVEGSRFRRGDTGTIHLPGDAGSGRQKDPQSTGDPIRDLLNHRR